MSGETARKSRGTHPTSPSVSDQVVERLSPYLGELNARVWVKVVAQRDLGVEPDEVSIADLRTVIEGLRPSLNTFMGRDAAEDLLKRVSREVR